VGKPRKVTHAPPTPPAPPKPPAVKPPAEPCNVYQHPHGCPRP
jgi:hypothetical protein